MKKSVLLLFLFFNVLLYSQESEEGKPIFRDYMNNLISSPIVNFDETFITPLELINKLNPINKSLDNDLELKNIDEYIRKNPKANYLNFYGKKIEIKKDFKVESTKFKLNDKFICLLKIKSENAYSLQVFFSKFNLPEKSKFFLYNSEGMVLGSFSNKNIIVSKNSDNVFVTQPIQGNEVYLELDMEEESQLSQVDIHINTIMHGFSNLYSKDGPFSGNDATTYTSCNKNVSCVDGGLIEGYSYNSTINKGNMKSVGLIVNTNAIYGFTCSGTLINNTKQDGVPYFLTAEHCVKGSPQQPVFLNESIVIFNHETKRCSDDGNTISGDIASPSTNSVGGMQILTSMGITKYPDGTYSGLSQDFALVKLNTTADILKKYKVCYSGWSTVQFPNNIGASFTAHHPSGTVKKISVINQSYITPTNYSAIYDYSNTENPNVYFSKSFSTNLSQGYFLAAEFANGFPYHGSSGASLFTRDGFILGTLSSGPEQEISNETPVKPINMLTDKFKACASTLTNKAKYNVLFSRFWRDYIFMQPWLNPDSQNVQSIGNYCPAGIGAWGSVNIENPQEGCNTSTLTDKYILPDKFAETIKDLNQYRVKPFSTYGKKIYVKTPINFSDDGSGRYLEPVMSDKLLCLGLDNTCQGYYVSHSYRITSNSIKKIKPKDVSMTNQLNINGVIPPIRYDVISADGDRLAVLAQQSKLYGNDSYNKVEVELYKYNENTNEYDTDSVIDVFDNPLTLEQTFPNVTNYGQIRGFYEENMVIILIKYAVNGPRLGMVKFYRQNENSPWIKSVFPLIYQSPFNVPMYDNFKAFFKNEVLLINSTMATLLFNVKPKTVETPALLINKVGAEMLGIANINYQGNNIYELFGMKNNKINVWRFNISTTSLVNYFNISLPNNYNNTNVPINRFYDKRLYANKNILILPEYNGRRTFYFKEGNDWVLYGTPYTSPSRTTTSLPNPLFALNDSYFFDDIQWQIYQGVGTRLYPAYNLINSEHLKRIFSIYGGYLSGAYVVLDNIEREEWFEGQVGFTKKYDNTKQPLNALQIVTSETDDGVGTALGNYAIKVDYRNPKSIILSHLTAPLIGNKNINLAAEHSIVIKPGFEVSSSTGVEFHAIATSAETYPESLTYDDMLHPVLSDYHDKASKKMANPLLKAFKEEFPTYGEIILNDGITNKEVVIDRGVKLYPNPTKDILTIDFNGNVFRTLEVYSIDAKKILTQEVSSKNSTEVNLSRYPAGIYMVTLTDSNGKTYPNKVIKK